MHNVITATVAITQLTGNLDAVHHHLVPGDQDGVDHKIRILQTLTPIRGGLQMEHCTNFMRVALAKRMGCRQALWVYIHQANCTAGQIGGQAQVLDKGQGEASAACTNDRDFGCHKDYLSLAQSMASSGAMP